MSISSDRIEHLVNQVRSGAFSEQELVSLYHIAEKLNVAPVMEAGSRKMRGEFPKAAKRLFGAKEAPAMQRLQEALQSFAADGRSKVTVKPGGAMLSGEKYIEVSCSFKNAPNRATDLSLVQDTPDSELFAQVTQYATGESGVISQNRYAMSDFDSALEEFRRLAVQAPRNAQG